MKIYEIPEIEIEKFGIVDVITGASGEEGGEGSDWEDL